MEDVLTQQLLTTNYNILWLFLIKHALNPGKCFIFTDFVQCSYFELRQGNGVTARTRTEKHISEG